MTIFRWSHILMQKYGLLIFCPLSEIPIGKNFACDKSHGYGKSIFGDNLNN